ncbi:hypothetical protein AB0F73_12560 [Micromonospora purpureochromogenes]|uniref:hypothetical protein n=1 Tax=Micromonospora purpureochromogenes TaxID=47872 RepID=UPI0033D32C43
MIDRKLLLSDLQKQVKNLEKDVREQVEPVDEVPLRLRGEYDRARGQAHRRHLGGVARGGVTHVAAPGYSTPGWRSA